MHIDKKSAQYLFAVVAGGIALYLGLKHITPVLDALRGFFGFLAPLTTGLCIAFILNIPMSFFERTLLKLLPKKAGRQRRWVRPVCIVVTLLVFLGAIALVMFIVIPEMSRTIQALPQQLSSYLARLDQWIGSLSAKMPSVMVQLEELGLDLAALSKRFFGMLQSVGLQIVNSSFVAVGDVFKGAFSFFVGLVFSFYVLSNKEHLGHQADRILKAFAPSRIYQRTSELFSISHRTFTSFFTGQFVEAMILGLLFLIGMTIFGFPHATLVSVLIAFTALIPIFGAFIGCFVGAFLILVVSPVQAFWFLVFFIVLQQLEGNLIYPRVVGSSIGLPAIWVLAAVTVGGSMFGILGMLLFIPLFSVAYGLLRRAVNTRLGQDVSAEPEPTPKPIRKKPKKERRR